MELFKLIGSIFIDSSQAEGAMSDIQQKAEALGQGFQQTGQTVGAVGAGVAASVGLIGGSLLNSAMDADAASAQIQASLGYTKDQADALVESAKGIYNNGFGESLGEVSQEMVNVKQQMQGLNDSELSGVTQQAMVLAQTLDEDVGAVARSADMLMTQFGISSTEAFDLMAVGQQKGLNFSGEFLDTLNEYSVHFQQMGFTAEEAFAMMVAGSENGAFNLDKVGDSIKENFLRLSDMGKPQIAAMESLGLASDDVMAKINAGGDSAKDAYAQVMTSIAGVTDETERNRIGVELFGTQWEDVGEKVVLAMQPSTDVLGEVEGAAKKAGDAVEGSVSQQAIALWRDFKSAAEPLGKILLDMAQDALPTVKAAVEDLTGFFKEMPEPMQKIVVAGGLIAGALGLLMLAISPLLIGIGALIPLFTGGGIAAGVFSAGMLPIAATILGVIAGITALATAVYLIYTNWDKVTEFFTGLWEGVKTTFTTFFTWVSETIASWDLKASIASVFEGVKEFWEEVWTGLGGIVEKVFGGAKKIIDGIVGGIGSIISTAGKAIEALKSLVGWQSKDKKGGGTKTVIVESDTLKKTGNEAARSRNAYGTDNFEGGWSVVGEQGRELVQLPTGSRIYSNPDTENIMGGGKGGITQNFTINSPVSNPSEIARKFKQASRSLALEWGV